MKKMNSILIIFSFIFFFASLKNSYSLGRKGLFSSGFEENDQESNNSGPSIFDENFNLGALMLIDPKHGLLDFTYGDILDLPLISVVNTRRKFRRDRKNDNDVVRKRSVVLLSEEDLVKRLKKPIEFFLQKDFRETKLPKFSQGGIDIFMPKQKSFLKALVKFHNLDVSYLDDSKIDAIKQIFKDRMKTRVDYYLLFNEIIKQDIEFLVCGILSFENGRIIFSDAEEPFVIIDRSKIINIVLDIKKMENNATNYSAIRRGITGFFKRMDLYPIGSSPDFIAFILSQFKSKGININFLEFNSKYMIFKK